MRIVLAVCAVGFLLTSTGAVAGPIQEYIAYTNVDLYTCTLTAKSASYGGDVSKMYECAYGYESKIADKYNAAKSAAGKNAKLLSMLKEFKATATSSFRALVPSDSERRMFYEERLDRQQRELEALGERISAELE